MNEYKKYYSTENKQICNNTLNSLNYYPKLDSIMHYLWRASNSNIISMRFCVIFRMVR